MRTSSRRAPSASATRSPRGCVLNNHTHVPGLGPDLFAFGVLAGEERPAREVFCGIDDDPVRVDEMRRKR